MNGTLQRYVLIGTCWTLALAIDALGQPSCQIAWNTFNPVIGPNGGVGGMCVHDGKLIMRGAFTSAGGVPISNLVAAYDGNTWTDIGQGYTLSLFNTGPNQMVSAFGKVYAAGQVFVSFNPQRTAPGQYWDGTSWRTTPMGGLTNGQSVTFFPSGGKLYSYGSFGFAGPDGFQAYTRSIALWDGVGNWQPLDVAYGVNAQVGSVRTIVEYNGAVFVAGSFPRIDHFAQIPQHIPVRNIARFIGGGWFEAGSGVNAAASLVQFNNELYAYGNFTATGAGTPLNRLAKWSGTSWIPVAGGLSAEPSRVIVGDDSRGTALFIFVTGTATNTDSRYPATVAANGVVRFDGTGFTGLPAAGGVIINDIVSGELRRADSAVYASMNNRSLGTGGPGNLARLGRVEGIDTDGDGLPDSWESEGGGLDINCDGTVELNLYALGARPDHKDMFVEVDAMVGMLPDNTPIEQVIDAFAVAPANQVNNPDGQPGIRLHVLVDRTDLPVQHFPDGFREFHQIKASNFGTAADRADANSAAILEAKRKVYRYCIFASTFDDSQSSGVAELPGNDFMVTLGNPNWAAVVNTDHRAGTFMHELGHTLELYHGGRQADENHERRYNYKPNYHSIMNYAWQFPGRAGWVLDYSRQTLPPLNEAMLVESSGIQGDPAAIALVGPAPGIPAPEEGPIDYDRNGLIDPVLLAADINYLYTTDAPSPGDTLEGHTDWPALRLNFRNTDGYAEGGAPRTTGHDEMTYEVFALLQQFNDPPACLADFNGDGFVDPDDLSDFVTCFFLDVQFPGTCADADFNGDGFRDPDDLSDFITTFFTAGC